MSFPKQHKLVAGSIPYNHLFFDSVLSFNEFVDDEMKKLSAGNSEVWEGTLKSTKENIQAESDWYGSPIPAGIGDLENHKKFLGMHLLKSVQEKIQQHLARYLEYINSEILPKRKLAYNDKGLGLFSFDRAGIALLKAHKINLDTPTDEMITKLKIELGKTCIRTRMKEVYAYFQNKNVSYPSIRLYVMAGANANIKGNEILYVGIACSELVEFLEARGVPVEVNVMLGSEFNRQVTLGVVRVKRFDQKPDRNQLLLLCSDPRYFRYRGFKGIIALANYFDFVIPSSLGRVFANMGNAFVESLGENGFVFEQSYSLERSSNEVTRIIETYAKRIRNGNKIRRTGYQTNNG